MDVTSPAESNSLLPASKNVKWMLESESDSLHASRRRRRRRRLGFVMLLTSFVFLAGLILALAAPQHKRQVSGPVIASNFQDPSVVESGGTWYAYAGVNGNPPGINVLVATSTDFSTWTVRSGYDALPKLPSWAASPPHVWAPDVTQLVCTLPDFFRIPRCPCRIPLTLANK